MPKTHHADNSFSQITDLVYLGYNMCCNIHFRKLQELGIDADINVEGENPELPEKVEVSLWLPTPEHHAPSPIQLTVGATVIDNLVKHGKRVYVHCEKGHVRSAIVVAAYLIHTGMTTEEALEYIKEKRTVIHPNEEHAKALKAFEGLTRG